MPSVWSPADTLLGKVCLFLCLVMGGGACAASTPKSFEASYTPTSAPPECTQAVDVEGRRRCLAGDGDGCADAVRRLTPTMTFAESMTLVVPRVHNAQMECIVSYTTQGCNLGSGSSCSILGSARALLGDKTGARAAWLAACDRDVANSCWLASELGGTKGKWPTPTYENLLLAERGCDLGSFGACAALGDLALFGGERPFSPDDMVDRFHDQRGDAARGLYFWERACLYGEETRRRGWSDGHICSDLRKLLMVSDAPRRTEDDLLPILSLLSVSAQAPKVPMCTKLVDRGNEVEQVEVPCREMGGGGDICTIDPSACPKPPTPRRAHPWPPQLDAIAKQKRAPLERTRILDAHRASCARGNANECMRNIELELMRFPYLIYDEERNQGEPPAFEPVPAARDLCTKGVAEACAYVATIEHDMARAIRACDLGSPRGCALAGHHFGRTGPKAQQGSALLARACTGGIRWACALR